MNRPVPTPGRRLRAVVVDDEPFARGTVASLLRRDPDIEVVGECGSGAEAVAVVDRTQPDMVFLDIQMPECDGFEVLERLGPRLGAEIVFVTAYDTYAVQAFEAGALDYVLKPFDDERFDLALRRVKARLAREDARRAERRLFIRDARQISLVHIDEIDWIEAADYYACLHVGSRTHLIRRPIRQLERELDDSVFCRIHRSTIVNLAQIRALEETTGGDYDVVLHTGARLRLSRRYRHRLRERLARPGPTPASARSRDRPAPRGARARTLPRRRP